MGKHRSWIIASSVLSILLFLVLTGSGKMAFAMGPGNCWSYDPNGVEYDAAYTYFAISNGTMTVDVLHNNVPLNVDVSKGYTITYTLHAFANGTFSSGTQTFTNTTQLASVWEN